MSKKYEDYDNYEYEETELSNNSLLIKKILIVLLVLIAVFIIVFLLKSCGKKNNQSTTEVTEDTKYETTLLDGAKKYYEENEDKYPEKAGECTEVTLATLLEGKYVDNTVFSKCETGKTYVRVCVLTNGKKQFTPWFTCSDKKSETEYDTLKEGTIDDVITNSTYVEFKFLPQILKSSSTALGKVEELWSTDIKYSTYKTLGKTNYYRFRDKLFTWKLTTNNYYSSTGDSTNASDIKEYYASSPKSEYTKYDNGTTAYKWYTQDYKLAANGETQFFEDCPDDYPYSGGIKPVTMYKTAIESSSYAPTKYYICSTTEDGKDTALIYSPTECSKRNEESAKQYKYQIGFIYSCADSKSSSDTILGKKVESETDKCYSKWSDPTDTECDTSKSTCRAGTVNLKICYRKKYYKSGSVNANDEKVYYTSEPASGTYKDESTKATVYKWYKETTTTTSDYSATAPSNVSYSKAEKTNNYKWSDWSDWSTKKETAEGVSRTYETKTKIKLQQIYNAGEIEWTELSKDYVTLEEMITIFKNNKYEVESLSDIDNNGEIGYKIKMYIRNKKTKEAK